MRSIELTLSTRLSSEIDELAAWLQLTPQEHTARLHLARQLIDGIPAAVDDVKLSLFGSQTTGLADPMSDVDLKVTIPSWEAAAETRGPSQGLGRPINRSSVQRKLLRISQHLRKHGYDRHVIIANASNPLLKVRHAASGIDFQIVFSRSTSSQEILIKHYMDDTPHIRIVYMILKATLAARGLNEPVKGGLGSYPLFMLIAHVLKPPGQHRQNYDTSYMSLKAVLRYWARAETDGFVFAVREQNKNTRRQKRPRGVLVALPKKKQAQLDEDPVRGHMSCDYEAMLIIRTGRGRTSQNPKQYEDRAVGFSTTGP